MTPPKDPLAQSVHDRLLRLAADRKEDFNALLGRYGIERVLYRLSRTRHGRRFVLKGAMLFIVWLNRLERPTRDVDLLGLGQVDEQTLRAVFADVCAVQVEPDGLVFDPTSVAVEPIRENQTYGGLRVKLRGSLGNARVAVQIDVGVGDVITPSSVEADYPTLLDLPAPHLRVYPRETAVAKKLHAMVQLAARNSRMKDFFDVWLMSRTFEFAGDVLANAIQQTFARRQTALAVEPTCFTETFASDASKMAQWKAFVRRVRVTDMPQEFTGVMKPIRAFVQPIIAALAEGRDFDHRWSPGGPWRPAS